MVTDLPALKRALSLLENTSLNVFARDLLTRFRDHGYADATAVRYVRVIAYFGEWLDDKHFAPSAFSDDLVSDFIDHHLLGPLCRTRVDRDRKSIRAGLRHLHDVLCGKGVILPAASQGHLPSFVRDEVDRFDEYLARVRGLSSATRTYCRRYAGYFLNWRFGSAPFVPDDLCSVDLRHFVFERFENCRPGTVGVIATALRNYLRYLEFLGHSVDHLTNAVPTAAQWSKGRVPQHLTEDQERRFLDGVDRTCPSGRRDYAMLLVMCRLGLRASDVAALTLDDIDWRHGIVSLHAPKSRKIHVLPLPRAVGDAIVAYLRDGRPADCDRHIFLRRRPPVGRAVSAELIRGAVRRAYMRAGLPSSWTGTHRLRHTAAVRMLQRGATIKQIADVLGHRCIDTTAIYAKVDFEALREVAPPWPRRAA